MIKANKATLELTRAEAELLNLAMMNLVEEKKEHMLRLAKEPINPTSAEMAVRAHTASDKLSRKVNNLCKTF